MAVTISRRDFLKGTAATAATLAVSTACGGLYTQKAVLAEEDFDFSAYTETSTELYYEVLGEFYDSYQVALAAETVPERYALMAIAEAKLMESAVTLPTTTDGGYYRITKIVPGSGSSVMWGSDSYRMHNYLLTTEALKAADYTELRTMWNELRGTGTFMDSALAYLEENGYETKDDYSLNYNADAVTWDVLSSSLTVDCEKVVQTYDGLLEYDNENQLQPALAESYEVSDDGLTYTFHIREGVSWVDVQGREVAAVVADDFVAGLQHMMDAQGGLEYLIEGIIKNASEYIYGEITDFSEVGVEATDDTTLVFTLENPCSYFLTMLGYSVFAPMSRTYYESMGGKFGMDYDPSAADYTYGKGPDSIAYCGPYLVSSLTEQNSIVFSANPTYWNAENVRLQTITWKYNDGSDPTKYYTDFTSGTIDYVSLSDSIVQLAVDDGIFDEYSVVSGTGSMTYYNNYNLNRIALANFNDGTTAASSKTEEDVERCNQAMRNVHFRRALSFATDRGSMNAQSVGEELKLVSVRNSLTPGRFVTLDEEVTVDINGEATTFAAGTYYGAVMQAQVDAAGGPRPVYSADADDGTGSSDGFDGWFNEENAAAEFETAVAELAEAGVEVTAAPPIYGDLVYVSQVEALVNRANVMKQSMESILGGAVILNLVDAGDYDGWYYATYYPSYGYEMNCDINDGTGWGPDYGDPSTFLDTALPDYVGYTTKCYGLF